MRESLEGSPGRGAYAYIGLYKHSIIKCKKYVRVGGGDWEEMSYDLYSLGVFNH